MTVNKFSIVYVLMLLLFVSCDCKLKTGDADDDVKTIIEVQRYDRLQSRYLTTGDFSALQQMSTGYPMETRILIEDILEIGQVNDADINSKFLNFFQDTIAQTIITEAEAQYAVMDDINSQLTDAFHNLSKMLPDIKIPMIYAQISAFQQSIVVSDDAIGISIDKYLGENYSLYSRYFTDEQRSQMNRDNILPDCISFYLISKYPLRDFDTRSQHDCDVYIAKIHWVVNKSSGRKYYDNKTISAIDRYMSSRHDVSVDDMLRDTVYTIFP